MSYSAMQISKYIINIMHGEVSNLKLQKVLFYAQMEYIQKYNEKLFDDTIEAWRHGPVVREVYREFKKYMSLPIGMNPYEVRDVSYGHLLHDSAAIKVLDDVINKTHDIDAWDLVSKTHETSAWKDNYIEDWNNEISFSDLQKSDFNLG